MSAIQNKPDLLQAILTERRRLDHTLIRLSEAEMLLPGACGEWTAKDLLAHLAGWEQLLRGWYAARVEMREPQEPPEVRTMKAIHQTNAALYLTYRDWSLEQVRTLYRTSYDSTLEVVRGIPEAELFTRGFYPWTGRWLLADFVIANTSNHYRWAKSMLQRWLKTKV